MGLSPQHTPTRKIESMTPACTGGVQQVQGKIEELQTKTIPRAIAASKDGMMKEIGSAGAAGSGTALGT